MSKKKRRGTAREWVGYDFWREYLGKAGDDVRYGHGAGGGAAGSHSPGRGRRAAARCGGGDIWSCQLVLSETSAGIFLEKDYRLL